MDKNGKSALICGTNPKYLARKAAFCVRVLAVVSVRFTDRPRKVKIWHSTGSRARDSKPSSVLLPHPDGPVMAKRFPACTENSGTCKVKLLSGDCHARSRTCRSCGAAVRGGLPAARGKRPHHHPCCAQGEPTVRDGIQNPDKGAGGLQCCSGWCAGLWLPLPARCPA